jgi:quercetin dioxygenase-like cupin family protein
MKLIPATMTAIAIGVSSAGAGSTVIVTPVARATSTIDGQPIILPQENAEVAVAIYELPPGAVLPQSADPGVRYDYVLSGRLHVTNPKSGAVSEFSQGDFFVAPAGPWKSATNNGDVNARILVIRQAPVDNTGRHWLRTANGYFLMPWHE